MKKLTLLPKVSLGLIAMSTSLLLSPVLYASSTCDTCSLMTNSNSHLKNIETYTNKTQSKVDTSNNYLSDILNAISQTLYSTLPDLGNTMASYSILPSVQSKAYNDQVKTMQEIQTYFLGTTDDTTLATNFPKIFPQSAGGDLDNSLFPDAYSANTLFLDPSQNGYYTSEGDTKAKLYITLLSGSALSTMRKPDSSWEDVNSDDADTLEKIRTYNANYYTVAAMQSLDAYNLSQLYALNKGYDLDGELNDYSASKISTSGLINYLVNEKVTNQTWYNDLGSMSVGSAVKEIVTLVAGSFLELHRIELLQRQMLATETAMLTTNISSLTQALSTMKDDAKTADEDDEDTDSTDNSTDYNDDQTDDTDIN